MTLATLIAAANSWVGQLLRKLAVKCSVDELARRRANEKADDDARADRSA